MTWYPPYVVSGTQGLLYWQKGLYLFACMYNKARLCLKVNSKAIWRNRNGMKWGDSFHATPTRSIVNVNIRK